VSKRITIVGGGLAGLGLGIALRREGAPVAIIEAGRYPRHRVCGEFISGHGRDVLQGWGLEKILYSAGAREAGDAAFFSGCKRQILSLPEPALCLSRYAMDAALADEFVALGGELRTNTRWKEDFGEGLVRATGRRVRANVGGWRWFGLKVHARNIEMSAGLEMHLFTNGYVGLCRLRDGVTNICGLFRDRKRTPDLSRNWLDFFRREDAPELSRRLENAEFDRDSFCAVGGLWLQPQSAAGHPECCVGDALTMIAPITGNGMSMAFESAQLAVQPLLHYSRGESQWETARAEVAERCDHAFQRRLKWSRSFQSLAMRPALTSAILFSAMRWRPVWEGAFFQTRR
jgi:flavin-dependent dehydrogenase